MTISDLLTLFGILLAIFAFIAERNREYVFLKLSVINIRFIIGVFIYIHFLLSYEWWLSKFSRLSLFIFEGFPSPEIWAYIISVSILIWSVWCIFDRQFPLSRKEKLISYYRKLMLRNDIPFLAQLIEDYHLKQITQYLKAKCEISIENPTDNSVFFHRNIDSDEKYLEKISQETLTYGRYIYCDFILNDIFIENVANVNPYLFSDVIAELRHSSLKEDDFVNKFLKTLVVNKNSSFFREIRGNQNFSEFKAYRIEKERPILYALFNDVNVCAINQAWRGIGDQAILEMMEESKKEYSPLRESDQEQDKDTIWTYQINIAIWYFDIMVRAAIIQKVNDNMWMFYYRNFCQAILSNMQDLPDELLEQNRKSRNFDLLEMIFTKMQDWIDVGRESGNNNLAGSVYECIRKCIGELTVSKKLRTEDKHYLINMLWEHLIQLSINKITITPEMTVAEKEEIEKKEIVEIAIVDNLLISGFEAFRSVISFISKEQRKDYVELLEFLWIKRDIPILKGVYEERADKFKNEVIDKLKMI